MPDREQHLTAARMNSQLASELARDTHPTKQVWTPTVTFYAGVQVVEAALAMLGEHPRGHPDREAAIASRWPTASVPYKRLRQLSEYWRYYGRTPSNSDIRSAAVWLDALCDAIGEPRLPEPKNIAQPPTRGGPMPKPVSS